MPTANIPWFGQILTNLANASVKHKIEKTNVQASFSALTVEACLHFFSFPVFPLLFISPFVQPFLKLEKPAIHQDLCFPEKSILSPPQKKKVNNNQQHLEMSFPKKKSKTSTVTYCIPVFPSFAGRTAVGLLLLPAAPRLWPSAAAHHPPAPQKFEAPGADGGHGGELGAPEINPRKDVLLEVRING